MKSPMDLIINGAVEYEVLLYLHLMKMTQLEDPLAHTVWWSISTRSLCEPTQNWPRGYEENAPFLKVMRCVWGLDNESIPHLYEGIRCRNNRIIMDVQLPIKEDVEVCDNVEPLELPEPLPDEVIVGFQGGKET
jgi:hypothetical protein